MRALKLCEMAANSILLDFSIESSRVADELSRKDIVKTIKENVEKYFGNLKLVYDMVLDDGYLCILSDDTGVIFSLRFFNEGLITLNIEYFKREGESQKISFDVSKMQQIFVSSSPFHISKRFSGHILDFRAQSRDRRIDYSLI